MISTKRKSNGGVTLHAVSRLKKQHGFKGSNKEARRLLLACRRESDKMDRFPISASLLQKQGISAQMLKNWGVQDGNLMAVITNSTVITVID
ncbi:hypothetical protein ACFLY1_00230 [Patescibacteria group bacterium]